ncbi:hypothetical protein QVD17_17964 [Tagetes erecta]|uniref:Uncharacterized protein n=1 Tax=Tagetes erecta TaxID=13708 RepID=A0AAD8KJL4_TARER|nr:hypothetical protein QVD17_17964 [Tagetes erecta]
MKVKITGTPKRLCSLFDLTRNSKPDFRLKVLKVQYDYLPVGGALAFAFVLSPQEEHLFCNATAELKMTKLDAPYAPVIIVMCCYWATFAASDTLKYKDPKQPLNVRINDLLNRMTLEEKIGQMIQIDRSVASADVIQKYFIGSILSCGGSVPG